MNPASALCILLALAALFFYGTYRNGLRKVVVIAVVLGLVAWTNGDPYKLTYPGLKAYSLLPEKLRIITTAAARHNGFSSGLKLADLAQRGKAALVAGSDEEAIRLLTQRLHRGDHPAEVLKDRAMAYLASSDSRHKKSSEAEKKDLLDKALQDVGNAITITPNDADCYRLRADIQHHGGKSDEAIRDLTEAIRLDAINPVAYWYRGSIRYNTGDFDGAIDDYKVLTGLAPAEAVAYRYLGDALYAKKDYVQAAEQYGKAIEKDPNDALSYKFRGFSFDHRKDFDLAIKDLTEAIRLDAKDPVAYQYRGDIRYDKGDFDGAIADYEAVTRLAPAEAVAHRYLGDAWSAKKDYVRAAEQYGKAIEKDPNDALSYKFRGSVRYNRGDFDGAIADYEAVTRLAPADAVAHRYLGDALYAKKDYVRAAEQYGKAIEKDPNDALSYKFRGFSFDYRKDFDLAIKDLTEAIRLDAKDPVAYQYRGDIRYDKGDFDGAIADYEAVTRLAPADAVVHRYLGNAWYAKKDYVRAAEQYGKAIERDPNNALSYKYRGLSRYNLNEFDRAVEDFGEAIRLDKDDGVAYGNRGDARYWLKKYDLAVADYAEAIRIDPNDRIWLVNRASAYNELKKPDQARKDFLSAARLISRDGSVRPSTGGEWREALPEGSPAAKANALGVRAGRAGRDRDAAEHFKEALRLDPKIGALAFNLAITLSRTGNANQAVEKFADALALDPALIQVFPGTTPASPGAAPAAPCGGADEAIPGPACVEPVESSGPPGQAAPARRPDPVAPKAPARAPESGASVNPPRPPSVKTAPSGGPSTLSLIDDQAALEAWHRQRAGPTPVKVKPRLVVVAVSGGGIAAAYWTTLCLTSIEGRDPDFPYRVRIVTGSSGGMVGASYYVASLGRKGQEWGTDSSDRESQRKAMRDAMAMDCLTPVVRRLVLRDLPAIFCPRPQTRDRGRELERTWEAHTERADHRPTLGRKLSDLREGESQGWCPSLILSPTLVEEGCQLLMSNLELSESGRSPTLAGGTHFSDLFPDANGLTLSTAIRMNAAFPFVTPPTALPIDPPLRVADSGFLENYGIILSAEWLNRHLDWLKKNTSGVALIQLRAYAPGVKSKRKENQERPSRFARLLERIGTGLGELTVPIDTYTTAKLAAMLDANDSKLDELRKRFAEGKERSDFFKTFVLECDEEAPLGWSLTDSDRRRLDSSIATETNRNTLKSLHEFIGGPQG